MSKTSSPRLRRSPGASSTGALPPPAFHDPAHDITIYHGDSLELLSAFPAESVDLIFADPPYFLSNDGITCHAGRMVTVNKGEWDRSRGPDVNHEFNRAWRFLCQRVLKRNGTIWVSGTAHVIHSVGFAMQQLGTKLLNDITWVKPNPPPNLSCRYFTHATETLIWAAKGPKSKHTFHYRLMKEMNRGCQMKSVWEIAPPEPWEKRFGKHPTQKPLALLERILLASSNAGDLVLDPFLGSGTTAIAALRLRRRVCGIELNASFSLLSLRRLTSELCVVRMAVSAFWAPLDLRGLFMDRSQQRTREHRMPPRATIVHHETKYFFVGADPREVLFAVEAPSLDEAWRLFLASTKGGERIFSVIKTETEIYLAQ
jgi:site-specific DNA-methyltransferase (adenine-specific)